MKAPETLQACQSLAGLAYAWLLFTGFKHAVYSMLGYFVNQVQSSLISHAYSSEAVQIAIEDSPSSPKNHW